MLGGSGSHRRTGLGYTRGESKKLLGVVRRMRANSTNPFGAGETSRLTVNGLENKSSLADPSSPRSITSANSSAMDAILEKARMLSSSSGHTSVIPKRESIPSPPPVRKQSTAIPSCMSRARSIPPPPSVSTSFSSRPAFGSRSRHEPTSGSDSSSEIRELKELVTILQQRNKEYEEKLNNLQSFPFYGIVRDEAIYFFKDIPTNDQEWEENREGEATQNDWVPVLQGEKKTREGAWVSVLYMDPETGETDVFWTLKQGFAAFSLYPLLDRTVEDFV